ncbi:MAG TPA: hypothetical protein VFG30_32315 [Polyangiales bacterium]|nr:hypothetical protein [Polyangiales bacterium]
MASYLIIRHKVRDFSAWKTVFDAHRVKRVEAGLTDKQLMRSDADPNEVVIFCDAQDLNRARAFCESAELRDTMQKAGVSEKPDLYFLND